MQAFGATVILVNDCEQGVMMGTASQISFSDLDFCEIQNLSRNTKCPLRLSEHVEP